MFGTISWILREVNAKPEDAIEVFEPGMEGLKIAIEESRLYIFDPVTDPVRHQSLS